MTILIISGVVSQADAARVTSDFGMRREPFTHRAHMHAGMDMAAPIGVPVYATGDGWIRRARWVSGYGKLVEIAHGEGFLSRFGHLSEVDVREGQFVRRGDFLGRVGTTGHSTGPHLHYEVRINGVPVDPSRYMRIDAPAPASSPPVVTQVRYGTDPSSWQGSGRRGRRGKGYIEMDRTPDRWELESDYSGLAAGHVTAGE